MKNKPIEIRHYYGALVANFSRFRVNETDVVCISIGKKSKIAAHALIAKDGHVCKFPVNRETFVKTIPRNWIKTAPQVMDEIDTLLNELINEYEDAQHRECLFQSLKRSSFKNQVLDEGKEPRLVSSTCI